MTDYWTAPYTAGELVLYAQEIRDTGIEPL